MFDLRRREKVDKLGMVGVNGSRFPAIRKHLKEKIADVYADLDIRQDIFSDSLDGHSCDVSSVQQLHFLSV
jgi:D-galacturonate reductase